MAAADVAFPREEIEEFFSGNVSLDDSKNPVAKGLRGAGVEMKRGTSDMSILNDEEFQPYTWDSVCRLYKRGRTHFLVFTWKPEGDDDFANMPLRNPDGEWRWSGQVAPADSLSVCGVSIKNTHNRMAVWRF